MNKNKDIDAVDYIHGSDSIDDLDGGFDLTMNMVAFMLSAVIVVVVASVVYGLITLLNYYN